MSVDSLRDRTRRELEALARRKKVSGIRSMSKDQLISALKRTASAERASGSSGGRSAKRPGASQSRVNGRATRNGHARDGQSRRGHAGNGHGGNGRTRKVSSRPAAARSPVVATGRSNVVLNAPPGGQDRLFSTAIDAHWFDVRWSLTAGMLRRAEAFFGLDWRNVRAVIRIYDVTSEEGTATARAYVRDEVLTAETDRWFVRVGRLDRTWLFEIGFLGPKGRFFALAHGEPIGAPGPLSRVRRHSSRGDKSRNGGSGDVPPGSPLIPHLVRAAHRKSVNGEPDERGENSVVRLHAELVVHGTADPGSELRLMKDRIPLSRDGNFSLKLPLENGRVVIPVEHVSSDGAEQRTVILAIERSTRVLEAQMLDETAE